MTEDRMLRALAELDMPAMPDPGFADRLYESLATELGLKPAATTGSPLVVPLAPVDTAGTRSRVPHGARRAAMTLLAAALLLLALLAAGLLIAGQLRPRTPVETVERSRAAYVQAPAVRFTITDEVGTTTVTGDGRGTWRSTSAYGAPGDFVLYDGARTGGYTASTRTWNVIRVEDGGPPYPFNMPFTWTDISYPGLLATLKPVACSDALVAPPMTIVGRDATGIVCPSIRMTYWVDPETGLVLRSEAAFGSPYWNGAFVDPASGDVQDESPTVIEVASFEVLASVDPAEYDWDGPARTVRTGPIPGTGLVIGERPPSWSGTTLDGAAVTLPDAGGPMAVLLWDSFRASGRAADELFGAATQTTPGLRRLAVSLDEQGTLAGYRTQHPSALPQVADPAGELLAAWGVQSTPALVMLDADGRVVELASAAPADTDLLGTLAAFAAGTPIVIPAEQSSASPPPVFPQVTCDVETHLVCVEPGDPLPAWEGRTTNGRSISSASLTGRPTVLWLDSPGSCGGPCPDEIGDLVGRMGDLASTHVGRANVVLIVSRETEPGGTEAVLDAAGAAFDVVHDWDGTINRALATQTSGVILVDAGGRVAGQWTGMLDVSGIRAALDTVEAPVSP